MLGFTPFKRRANKFNYIPRFYDPEKEAREERRAELRGERRDTPKEEYKPGQYIRTQSRARAARYAEADSAGRAKIIKLAVGVVLAMLFIALLFPKLADLMIMIQQPAKAEVEAVEQFDRYAPITVVPNDYVEQEE